MRSLFPDRDEGCYICGSPYVEQHHIFYGTGRRPISDREGCTVWLCREHHQGRMGVHGPRHMHDLELKEECQRRWEAREGVDEPWHETFIRVFGRNYL